MPGPTHSNRSFKSNKGLKVEPGTECVIEIWDARDFETKEDIKAAIDIKIYKKDPDKEYSKGESIGFFRAFKNEPKPLKEKDQDAEIPI